MSFSSLASATRIFWVPETDRLPAATGAGSRMAAASTTSRVKRRRRSGYRKGSRSCGAAIAAMTMDEHPHAAGANRCGVERQGVGPPLQTPVDQPAFT